MMKRLMQTLFCCLCVACSVQAQNKPKEVKEDSHYLAGAVPEVDGKVVFSHTYNLPGMLREDVYTSVLNWMQTRLAANDNISRVVYTNPDAGQIVGSGDEWIVFSSSALSLDRTRIKYQLSALCEPEKCTLNIEKINFVYREGEEKYTAEEWVTDAIALNKARTKLVRGLAKWRRNTVDFADNMFKDLAEALPAVQSTPAPTEAVTPVPLPAPAPVFTQPATATPTQPAATPATKPLTEIVPSTLSPDAIKAGAGKLVIIIGSDSFNMTTMTANAGGSLGQIAGEAVIFTFLAPDQPSGALDLANTYTVMFYPNGAKEPSVVLECKKLPAPTPMEGQPRMYVGGIMKASIR
jgi:hypothetical protein